MWVNWAICDGSLHEIRGILKSLLAQSWTKTERTPENSYGKMCALFYFTCTVPTDNQNIYHELGFPLMKMLLMMEISRSEDIRQLTCS